MIDLPAYLRRIGHPGPVAPDLTTLRALAYAHATTIPFENLDPFSGRAVDLAPEVVEAKLVGAGRGGYCYEHNRLFQAALDQIGFTTSSLLARVLWGGPDDVPSPRSHKLLRVELDGVSHLVDVGFGTMRLTGVLRLEPDLVQETPHEPFRLVRDADDTWRQQALVAGAWRTTYRFDLVPTLPVDDEAPNWRNSTWPGSHFVTGLIAARPAAGRRYALSGRQFAVHHLDGPSEKHPLADLDELLKVLQDDLLVRVPEPALPALARLF